MPKVPLLGINDATFQGPSGTAIQIGTREVDVKELLDASSLPVLFGWFGLVCFE